MDAKSCFAFTDEKGDDVDVGVFEGCWTRGCHLERRISEWYTKTKGWNYFALGFETTVKVFIL